MLWWLLRSPWGRAFAALRDNPIRAESLGVNTRRYTLLAFAIGAGLRAASPARSTRRWSSSSTRRRSRSAVADLLLMVIVGGSGHFFGPFVGTVVGVLLPEWLRFAQGVLPDGLRARW